MSACVGWHGDCAIYGDMHGCKLPDGHSGTNHVCGCGALARAKRALPPIRTHGDHAGYMAHRRRHEPPCAECRAGHARYRAEWKDRAA